MNTQERIYSKLNSINKVELEAHKIELGAIDDLKKKLDKKITELDKSISKKRNLTGEFVDLEIDFEKIMNQASLISKQVSDLGVKEPKNLGFINLKAKELKKLSREIINDLRQ